MHSHITLKLEENIENNKVLKVTLEKNSKETNNRLTVEFSMAATINARRERGNTFEMLKENNFQPRILYITKLPLKRKGNKDLLS